MAPPAGTDTIVIDGCAIATVDAAGTEHPTGHVVVTGGRITAIGAGFAPRIDGARRVDGGGDLLAAEIEAARRIGLRFCATRGSMNLGHSSGGLPPDEVVEDADRILSECEAAVAAYHDASFDSLLQVALAPCSPFSVTGELMRDCAQLARALGVRLHTHLAETSDEEEFCLAHFGARPVDYVESLGWLGDGANTAVRLRPPCSQPVHGRGPSRND